MINEEIIRVVKDINERREDGIDNNYLILLIFEKSKELGITYLELYDLLFNKEYLLERINESIDATNERIQRLLEEVNDLKISQRNISSVICDLYGHEFTHYEGTNIQTCKICGKQELLSTNSKKLSLWKKHK